MSEGQDEDSDRRGPLYSRAGQGRTLRPSAPSSTPTSSSLTSHADYDISRHFDFGLEADPFAQRSLPVSRIPPPPGFTPGSSEHRSLGPSISSNTFAGYPGVFPPGMNPKHGNDDRSYPLLVGRHPQPPAHPVQFSSGAAERNSRSLGHMESSLSALTIGSKETRIQGNSIGHQPHLRQISVNSLFAQVNINPEPSTIPLATQPAIPYAESLPNRVHNQDKAKALLSFLKSPPPPPVQEQRSEPETVPEEKKKPRKQGPLRSSKALHSTCLAFTDIF